MRLSELRQNLKEALDAALPGVNIYGWQTKPTATPAAVLVTSDPAIDTDGPITAGKPWAVHYRVQLIAGRGSASAVEKSLDDMVTATVLGLHGLDEGNLRVTQAKMPLLNEDTNEIGAEVELTITIDMKES